MKIMPKGFTEKQWRVLDNTFEGDELCPYCGNESTFSINPTESMRAKCSYCGEKILICSLCNDCDGNCIKTMAESILEDNESEENNMSELIMCVYYSSIDPEYNGDDNLAYIKTSKETVEHFYDANIHSNFHSKIGESKFENWLIEYTADETTGLYIFLRDRDAIDVIYKPDGDTIEFDDDWCDTCKCFFRKPKRTHTCHRCGYMTKKTYTSFIDDEEKMIDLFTMKKAEFLNFYSYLTEEEYDLTIDEIVARSGYWHKEWREDNNYDGTVLKDIILGLMITEWLGKRGN